MEPSRRRLRLEVDGQVLTSILRRAPREDGRPSWSPCTAAPTRAATSRSPRRAGTVSSRKRPPGGFPAVAIDRPATAAARRSRPPRNNFARQAALLGEAIALLVAELDASGVFLVGHSIGG